METMGGLPIKVPAITAVIVIHLTTRQQNFGTLTHHHVILSPFYCPPQHKHDKHGIPKLCLIVGGSFWNSGKGIERITCAQNGSHVIQNMLFESGNAIVLRSRAASHHITTLFKNCAKACCPTDLAMGDLLQLRRLRMCWFYHLKQGSKTGGSYQTKHEQ